MVNGGPQLSPGGGSGAAKALAVARRSCLARRGAALAVAPPAYSSKALAAKWQAASSGLPHRPEYLHESWTHNERREHAGPGTSGGRTETLTALHHAPSAQAEARHEPAGERTNVKSGKKRILAVDDQACNTRLVKLYLEQTNEYVVREENNPNNAVAAAEEFGPDLILLDVMMPGLDGGDLAALFHASFKLAPVPIVFLTAAVTKGEVEADGGQIGGNLFLAKPIVLTELVACIRHHLGD